VRGVHALVGGLGYVGYSLAYTLAREGRRVIVISRRRSLRIAARRRIAEALERIGVELVLVSGKRIGVEDLESLQADVYYHLAGKIGGPYTAQWEAHVGLLSRVIEAAARLGSRVVYTSSILAFGRDPRIPPGSLVYEEESLTDGRLRRSIHARTKWEGEKLLASQSPRLGGRWSIVRPGLVVGPMAYHVEWRLLSLLSRLRLYPSSSIKLNIVYSLDLARVLTAAGEGRLDGKWVHAVANYYPSMAEFFGAACRIIAGGTCIGVPLNGLPKLARYAPPSTAAAAVGEALSWGYLFASRHLQGFKWTGMEEALKALAYGYIEWVDTQHEGHNLKSASGAGA